MIYFDNSATTKPYPEALETYMQVASKIVGNPSSLHRLGDQATRILDASRQQIADLIGKKSDEIFFTSGGTEGDNWVIKGVAFEKAQFGKHIIVSAIEHPAVKESALWLKSQGFEVDIAPVDEKGFLDVKALASLVRPDTILVSIMAVNNEIGSIQPIEAISELLADKPTISFHVDAVQAVGKLPIYPEEWGINFLSASAHKFHGPKGVGFLYADQMDFDNFMHGGDQENKHRAGTENLVSIVGMATALSENVAYLEENLEHAQQLKDTLLNNIADIDYYLNESQPSLPYVINIGFPNRKNDLILLQMDLNGFSISTGSACTAGAVQPSHVLQALYGSNSERLKESIRISVSDQTNIQEIKLFSQKLKEILGG